MLRGWVGFKMCLVCFLSLLLSRDIALCQIAAWDFTGASTPTTWAATTFNSNLVSASGANNITRGSGAAGSAGGNSFRSTGFQNNGIATTNTDYYQVTLKANSGYAVSLASIDANFAGTASFCVSPGVATQFAYSLDGSSFTLIGSAVALTGTPVSLSTISLSGITALQNVGSATTIYLRYYASGQTTTGGWGFFSAASGTNGLAIGGTVNTSGGCSGTPTAGTATASPAGVCTGATTALALRGASAGSGISYQWQSSTTGAGGTFTNISGATDTNYTTATLSANAYFKCVTTCSTSAASNTSNTDTITVTASVTPGISIAASPSGAVCSGTTVTYTATPSNGGSAPTYQWKKGGVSISGATNTTYSYTPANGDVITCVLTSNAPCASPATATSSSITMTVNPLPSPTISGTTSIASGSSTILSFSGTASDVVYYWNGAATNTTTLTGSGTATITVTPTVTTTYSVTSATSGAGCSQTITGQYAIITVTTGSASDTIPSRDDNTALGNPSGATTSTSNVNNYLMAKSQFTLSYNDSKGMANWVSWHLSRAWKGAEARCDCFTQDATLPSGYYRASTSNYTGTGFDRGHLCPSDDRDSLAADNAATFLMTNITPQAPNMNQQTWGDLEEYCRNLIYRGNEMYIIAGGYGNGGSGSSGGTTTTIASGNISVPSHFWKIIVVLPVGINDISRITNSTRVIAVIMPNTQSVNAHSWDYYATSVDSIESLTGYDFLSTVATGIQNVIEAKVDSRLLAWDLTGSGAYTTSVATIENANLDTAATYNTLARGSSAAASTGANSFRTTGFQNNGIATSNTDYFQVKVRAKSGYSVSLSSIDATYDGTASFYASPGVTSQYAYSLDGSAFTLIGSPVTSISATPPTVSLATISALQNVPSTTTIYLRYYASGQTTTGGWGYSSPYSNTYGLDIGGAVNISGCSGTPAAGTATATTDTVCSGNADTLALSTTSTGLGITYQWQSSATGAGGSFSNISGATDITYNTPAVSSRTYYKCITTCTTSALSNTSSAAIVNTRATVTPSITIGASPSGAVCAGASVAFTATPTNGGATPGYQWKKGGTNITGATNNTCTYAPANSDVITCVLASSAQCPSPATATSGGITMAVNAAVTPTVTIAASPTGAVCAGTSVNYTATPTNGGSAPTYQWKTGAINISGATNSTYNYTPANNDSITCVLTSNATCASPVTAISSRIIMTVNPTSPSGGTITGTTTVFAGSTATLANATAASGTVSWASSNTSVASVNTATGIVSGIAAGNAIITYTVTTACGTGADTALVTVTTAPANIAAWDLTGASTPTTWTATTFNSNLVSTSGANNLTRGAGASASAGANSFRTVGFQNNGISTANTDYYQVTLKAATGYTTSLSSINANFAGTASFCASPGVSGQFAYSLDGSSFTLIGSAFTLTGTPANMSAISLTGISALQNVGASTTIYLRYYASGQTTTGGWGFFSAASGTNGLAIGGNVSPVPCSGTPAHATATGTTTICSGNTVHPGLTGAATTYGIAYQWQKSTASSASGFSNISGATDTAYTSTALTTTTYYRCVTTCTFSGLADTSVAATITVNPLPDAGSISGPSLVCIGSAITLSNTATGGSWVSSNTALATVNTSGIVTGIAAGSPIISYTATNGCGTATTTYAISIAGMQWLGGASGHETDWNTAANWSCGFVPVATIDATIPSGTAYAPSIAASANGIVHNLTIAAGSRITTGTNAVLNVKGNLTNNGSVAGAGTTQMNGSSAQTVSGNGTFNNWEINNTGGVTLTGGAKQTIKSVLTLTAGTLYTNDSIVLQSDSTGTARIAPITTGAAISGEVKINQYIPGGLRRYRFWSHPFSNYIALSQLTNSIDITGTGGAANGFTNTASNAPSAFRYDPLVGNSGLGSDPGWRAFTSAFGTADSNRLHSYQGIRLFMRGTIGEGLGYGSYSPSPVVLGVHGNINQGNQTIVLVKGAGANQDYNMVGNPYPSPVDIGTVIYNAYASGNVTGAAYYVWNPNLGAAGQYQAIPINTVTATPYYLQAFTAFQVRAAHNGDTLHFTENNKAANASSSLLKAATDEIALSVYDNNYHLWNSVKIRFNDAAVNEETSDEDALLLGSSDFSFYTLSADEKRLVIDTRPYTSDVRIPVGLSSIYKQEFILKADNIPADVTTQLYLLDKENGAYTPLQNGTEYRFTISKKNSSHGERFEITTKNGVIVSQNDTALNVWVSPHPVKNIATLHFNELHSEPITVSVYDISGRVIFNKKMDVSASLQVELPMNDVPAGSYIVKLSSGRLLQTLKITTE